MDESTINLTIMFRLFGFHSSKDI